MKLLYLSMAKPACVHKPWTESGEGVQEPEGDQFGFSYRSGMNKLCFPNVAGERVEGPSW